MSPGLLDAQSLCLICRGMSSRIGWMKSHLCTQKAGPCTASACSTPYRLHAGFARQHQGLDLDRSDAAKQSLHACDINPILLKESTRHSLSSITSYMLILVLSVGFSILNSCFLSQPLSDNCGRTHAENRSPKYWCQSGPTQLPEQDLGNAVQRRRSMNNGRPLHSRC